MGEMQHMGAPPRRELYPSLMELRDFTPDTRAELERLARDRMTSGTSLMASGLDKLNAAAPQNNLAVMEQAAAQMRQGVLQFESGIASLHAIASGQAPREIALDWFKQNMDLLPSAEVETPHGIFGLSAFHYSMMFVLVAVSATLLWLNFRKMQRAQVLVARLAGPPEPVALPKEAVQPATQATPSTLSQDELPSRSNAWTGLLRVVRIFEETPNVRTLRLAHPSGEDLPFRHLPGQFVTLTVRPIDSTIKRSYTIASSPTRREYCEVTVKREEHGTVSSFLHSVHEGDTLQVTGPSGNFTFIGEGANNIVLISGGVGITPMMSVVRYLTDRSWPGDIFFVFACRADQDVIYRTELEYLQQRYPNLHLTITANDISRTDWPYARGSITKEVLAQAIPHLATRRVHLCGPPSMMTALKSMLAELGVPAEQIKTEIFIGRERPVALSGDVEAKAQVAAAKPPSLSDDAPAPGVAVATFARSKRTAVLPPTKTLLEASEDVGVNIEYSCRVGTCGVCKVKLLSGAVSMEVQEALDASDKQNNVILACQAKATADVTVDA
jgi:ferredoxin-NADP reductase